MRTMMLAVVMLWGCGSPSGQCRDVDAGGPFCVPDAGVARAGQTLKLQVIDQCIGGCGTASLACEVTRDAGTLTLGIVGTACEPPQGRVCTLDCALTPLDCTVPPLEPGDYVVNSPSQSQQVLHVEADAGETSCNAVPF